MVIVRTGAALAQANGAGAIFVWSLFLLIGIIVLFLAVVWLKRQLRDEPTGGTGFTLADLRELHRRGEMTDEEFERAREQMIRAARASAPPRPPASTGGSVERKPDR